MTGCLLQMRLEILLRIIRENVCFSAKEIEIYLDLQKSKMSSSQSFLSALQMDPGTFWSNIKKIWMYRYFNKVCVYNCCNNYYALILYINITY